MNRESSLAFSIEKQLRYKRVLIWMTGIIVIDVKIPWRIYKNIEDKQGKTRESSWYTRGEDVFHS